MHIAEDETIVSPDRLQKGWEFAHEQAWRYFALHAEQRMTVFNFFTILVGFLVAGIAATLQGSARFSAIGIALGGLLTLLSFVFWKLDQRMTFLIKHSEKIQVLSEENLMPEEGRTVTIEPFAFLESNSHRRLGRMWTVGSSFRLLFLVTALFGIVAASLCSLRYSGHLTWDSLVKQAESGKKLKEAEPKSLDSGAQKEPIKKAE